MSGYKPRDGSVAQRVIWHLGLQGESSTTDICDGCDDVTRGQLRACIATAVQHGAVFTRKVNGESWYSVKPFETVEVEVRKKRGRPTDTPQGGIKAESSERQAVQGPVVESLSGSPPAPPSPATRESAPEPRHELAREGGGAQIREGLAPHGCVEEAELAKQFACALYSDGRLCFEFDNYPVLVLEPDQTRVLLHYLDRLAPEAA